MTTQNSTRQQIDEILNVLYKTGKNRVWAAIQVSADSENDAIRIENRLADIGVKHISSGKDSEGYWYVRVTDLNIPTN